MLTAALLTALAAADEPARHEHFPIGPDRFLAEVLADLSAATGAPIRVGVTGADGAALVRDIERRLEPGAVRFQLALDEAGARSAARGWVAGGEACSALIRRVPDGWEYTTWGECRSTYARPDVAYAASLAALEGQAAQDDARRSVWLALGGHLDLLGGEACLSQQVSNPDPPPATLKRSTCWQGPVGADVYAGGVELGWVKREEDRRLARDVRIELGAFTGSGMPIFSPSLGARWWAGQDWLYLGARGKLLYLEPGVVGTVGLSPGPVFMELSAEAGGVAYTGSGVSVSVGGVFGDR